MTTKPFATTGEIFTKLMLLIQIAEIGRSAANAFDQVPNPFDRVRIEQLERQKNAERDVKSMQAETKNRYKNFLSNTQPIKNLRYRERSQQDQLTNSLRRR